MNKIFAVLFCTLGVINYWFSQGFEWTVIMLLLSIYYSIWGVEDEIIKKVSK